MRKLSHSEAGKLGAAKSAQTAAIAYANRVSKYDLDPKRCILCSTAIDYKKRKNNYCSQSCAATYNNIGVRRHGAPKPLKSWRQEVRTHISSELKERINDAKYLPHGNCLFCNKELIGGNPRNQYCDHACSSKHRKSVPLDAWLKGELLGHTGVAYQVKRFVREYLLEQANNTCSICGWNKCHPVDGRPLVEIDHIDGNASNTVFNNLRVLCPNCHSETPTFRARNKKSTRSR